MSKDAYYFSHDSNARHDPKILLLIEDYGMEGYGRWWVLVELLRGEAGYRLPYKRCGWNALAMQTQCTTDGSHKFIDDCINEYELLSSDGEYFWSESLRRRMSEKDEKSKQGRQAALKRWQRNADAMPTQCAPNAIKERKRKEKKGTPPTPPGGKATIDSWDGVTGRFRERFQITMKPETVRTQLIAHCLEYDKSPVQALDRIEELAKVGVKHLKPWDLFKGGGDKERKSTEEGAWWPIPSAEETRIAMEKEWGGANPWEESTYRPQISKPSKQS